MHLIDPERWQANRRPRRWPGATFGAAWGRSTTSRSRVAGLPRFRLYDLRHTFATHLLGQGAPITYVAAQLGAGLLRALDPVGRQAVDQPARGTAGGWRRVRW